MLSVISAELSATFSASPYLRKMLHFVCVFVTGDVQLCRVFASPHDVHVFIRRFHAKNLEARELCCCANVITVPLTFHDFHNQLSRIIIIMNLMSGHHLALEVGGADGAWLCPS